MTEKITVLGGGYSGVLSSILLAMLKDSKGTPLYKVTLLEEQDLLMNVSSRMPGRLHLGGEYPLDEETALECLKGAMAFIQMLGHEVLTDLPSVHYIASSEAVESGKLTLEKMNEQYQKIQSHYAHYFDKALAKLKNRDDVAKKLFGLPEDIVSAVDTALFSETETFAGGIQTKERGFHPAKLATFLEKALEQYGVDVKTGCHVADASKVGSKYNIAYEETNEHGFKESKTIETDQVVNATAGKSFQLDKKVAETEEEVTPKNLYLRAMVVLDISKCKTKPQTSFFGLIGESGGMYSPFNDDVALLYMPGDDGAYVGETALNNNTPLPPKEWDKMVQEGSKNPEIMARGNHILQKMKDRYPFIEGASVERVMICPTISINRELHQRHHIKSEEIEEGWHTAYSTKATFSPTTAINVLKNVQNRSLQNGRINKNDVTEPFKDEDALLLSDKLSLIGKVKLTTKDVKEYAQKHDMPEGITSDVHLDKKKGKMSSFLERIKETDGTHLIR